MGIDFKNKKNVAAVSTATLSFVLVGVLFFAPVKAFDFKGSMSNHLTSIETLDTLNSTKEKAAHDLDKLRSESSAKEKELAEVTTSASQSETLFDELLTKQKKNGNWSYHLPSILVELEKSADDSNVKVALKYDTFTAEGKYVSTSDKGLKYIDSKVEIYGDYADVHKYIKKVENVDFLSVEDLTLNQVKDGDLAGTFSLQIYYMGE